MTRSESPLRILVVVPYPPSPVRVRPYNLLRQLAARGHEVTLATLWADQEERDRVAELSAIPGVEVIAEPLPRWRPPWNATRALVGRDALQSAWCWQPSLAARLVEGAVAGRWQVAHVEHLRGARYGLALRSGAPSLPVVWDSVDCISALFAQAADKSHTLKGRVMGRLDLSRTRRQEGRLVHRFDRVLVTSQADRRALRTLAGPGGRAIEVLPNGVDLDYFIPVAGPRAAATIVISGKMSYHANVSAVMRLVDHILPALWRDHPAAQLQIVGKDPGAALRALERRHPERLTVTGTVPSLVPYLQQATIAVAPMTYAVGIQNKILEAMACATPVVTSPETLDGLGPEAAQALVVAEGDEAFAAAIGALLESPERREALGRAGRRYVKQHHAWPTIVGRLEQIYYESVADHMPVGV